VFYVELAAPKACLIVNDMQTNLKQTLSQFIHEKEEEGFTAHFKFKDEQLENIQSGKRYTPEQVEIVSLKRFEGMTNPSDMSIAYAIRCSDGIKGIVVGAFGPHGDPGMAEFFMKLEKK
jgi:hypothetical protein